jgi:hypothetical protein
LQGNAAANIVALGNTNATTTLDFTQGNNFSLTLTGSITLANPTGVTTGQSGLLLIQEDGTGGYTCAWGTSWDFAGSTAPTLTTTASALKCTSSFCEKRDQYCCWFCNCWYWYLFFPVGQNYEYSLEALMPLFNPGGEQDILFPVAAVQ